MDTTWVISAGVALAAGVLVGYFLRHMQLERSIKSRQTEANRILEQARGNAKDIELAAKDQALEIRNAAENEAKERRLELSQEDKRLARRRASIDRRFEQIDKREQALNKRQSSIDKRTNELEIRYAETLAELERVSQMTQDEAKEQLLAEVEREARVDMVRIIRQIEEAMGRES